MVVRRSFNKHSSYNKLNTYHLSKPSERLLKIHKGDKLMKRLKRTVVGSIDIEKIDAISNPYVESKIDSKFTNHLEFVEWRHRQRILNDESNQDEYGRCGDFMDGRLAASHETRMEYMRRKIIIIEFEFIIDVIIGGCKLKYKICKTEEITYRVEKEMKAKYELEVKLGKEKVYKELMESLRIKG